MELKQHTSKNPWVTEEIKMEIGKHFELNENENRTKWKFQDVTKAVLRGKFYSTKHRARKNERLINDISSYFKKLERKDQTQSVKKGNNKDQGKHQ